MEFFATVGCDHVMVDWCRAFVDPSSCIPIRIRTRTLTQPCVTKVSLHVLFKCKLDRILSLKTMFPQFRSLYLKLVTLLCSLPTLKSFVPIVRLRCPVRRTTDMLIPNKHATSMASLGKRLPTARTQTCSTVSGPAVWASRGSGRQMSEGTTGGLQRIS